MEMSNRVNKGTNVREKLNLSGQMKEGGTSSEQSECCALANEVLVVANPTFDTIRWSNLRVILGYG